ncbi:antitoxin [Nocardia sp. NBC_01329]|uniref:antitoxin n=1 Tax=Nocardia sp. NBC_01329 TaxID=2903594 RepID=UPI002E0F0E23|nr:antitoxin [Nocardia sp. NBC_01329]
MSLMDNLKNLVGKGQETAAKNSDKINQAVDKAGDFLDQKTKGKYSDKIQKGKEAARKVVPPEQPGSPGHPGGPGPGPDPRP